MNKNAPNTLGTAKTDEPTQKNGISKNKVDEEKISGKTVTEEISLTNSYTETEAHTKIRKMKCKKN